MTEPMRSLRLHPSARNRGYRSHFGNPRSRGCQQVPYIHVQRLGQSMQGCQCGVGQSRFHAAHIGPKHSASLRQLLLGHRLLKAQLFDPQTKGFLRGESCFRHMASVNLVYLFVHTRIRTLGGK
jgi:hypothetical protein